MIFMQARSCITDYRNTTHSEEIILWTRGEVFSTVQVELKEKYPNPSFHIVSSPQTSAAELQARGHHNPAMTSVL